MKQFRILAPIAIGVCMTTLLFSCNSGEEKKADESAVDTIAAKAPEPPAAPAKPANIMIVIHKVANFTKFLPVYEAHDSFRLAYGLHSSMLARGTKDTNMVMVVLRMDDAAKAKEFAALPGLKVAMKKSGVMGAPTISYLDMQMLDTTINGVSRVLISHKVKDWDAWKKVFEADKPNRMAAGLADRAVGYSVGDNHSVTMALVISDMKKAEDFSKSPELKKKMEEAGVEGPPAFFYYTVVKRY